MPRRSDADLCRFHDWEPGSILEFGPTLEAPPAYRYFDYYVLTAIGECAILCKSISSDWDHTFRSELVFRGQLYKKVIRKVGQSTVKDGKDTFDITEPLGNETAPASE